MNQNKKKSSWEWYAIKLLFVSTISGEPNKDKIDEKFNDKNKVFDEQILLVKAQSVDHAYKIAETKAKTHEMTYKNPYDQIVVHKFVDSITCQPTLEREVYSGIEVFSKLFQVPVETPHEVILKLYAEETQYCENIKDSPFYNFIINE